MPGKIVSTKSFDLDGKDVMATVPPDAASARTYYESSQTRSPIIECGAGPCGTANLGQLDSGERHARDEGHSGRMGHDAVRRDGPVRTRLPDVEPVPELMHFYSAAAIRTKAQMPCYGVRI